MREHRMGMLMGGCSPPLSLCGCLGVCSQGKGLASCCCPLVVFGMLLPARTAPCVNQLSGVHRLFALLTPVKVSQTAQDQDWQA